MSSTQHFSDPRKLSGSASVMNTTTSCFTSSASYNSFSFPIIYILNKCIALATTSNLRGKKSKHLTGQTILQRKCLKLRKNITFTVDDKRCVQKKICYNRKNVDVRMIISKRWSWVWWETIKHTHSLVI